MDAASEEYVDQVGRILHTCLDTNLIGCYLHGSAVLGDFDPRRSDIDMIIVCERPLLREQQQDISNKLSEESLPCPARGLELSVVLLEATDPDLLLHFVICRQSGRVIGPGLSAVDIFAPVETSVVLARVRWQLEWATEEVGGKYTVLTACRVWKYVEEKEFCSKTESAEWALQQTPQKYTLLIQDTLNFHSMHEFTDLDEALVKSFVDFVVDKIKRAP